MPIQQLIILGIVAMVGLAILRVVRVNHGLTPLPDGRARRLFQLGFVVVPPVALGLLTQPPPPANQLWGLGAVPLYFVILATLAIVMWIASQAIGQVTHGRAGRLLRLALAGHEVDPYEARVDPPVTAKLAESLVVVDRANAAFPRGPGFPSQVARSGFREDWDELDGATKTLEGRIADDYRRGLSVASGATATAADARSRLDTLRRLALDDGQAWAAA
ncbi:MAG TPA: hypothetical protein VFO05_06715 [Candidatus Limnocylindrales bacterium]|nr:hypothetical protein [Candidatus Limnocylindrales bacterium]